jgi:hypothetical protein
MDKHTPPTNITKKKGKNENPTRRISIFKEKKTDIELQK